MPSSDHIDVHILVDGQPLQEYMDPDIEDVDQSDSLNGNEIVRYVRAEAGQKFEAQITWKPGFALKGAPYLYNNLTVDDATEWRFHHIDTATLTKTAGLLKDPYTTTFSWRPTKTADGAWKQARYAFGALSLVEDDKRSTLNLDQAHKLGRIRICVNRAKKILRDSPFVEDGALPKVQEEITEKIMKGRDLKANVKYIVTDNKATAPVPRLHDYIPVSGDTGRVTTFIFKYRTKRALQNLGCIPRSPSPEPDRDLIISRQDDMINQQKADIERLRKELEHERNQSREHSIATTEDTAENRNRGICRKRSVVDDDVVETAPPSKKPAIRIDLTADDD